LNDAYKVLVSINRQRQSADQKLKIKHLSAFTFIEILSVIVILGLLSALSFPALSQAKRKAQQIQCAANLHELGIALNGYVADNQAYPLDGPWIYTLSLAWGRIDYTKGVWRCPSARWYADKFPRGWVAPSYTYNGYGLSAGGRGDTPLGLGGRNFIGGGPPAEESEVARPDDMMTIGDAPGPGMLFMRENLDHAEQFGNASERHQGRANVAFCDGHVESPMLAFLLNDLSDAALVRWNRDHEPHRELLTP
jgi:prepilin-type processing-associated H-X9-DG protein